MKYIVLPILIISLFGCGKDDNKNESKPTITEQNIIIDDSSILDLVVNDITDVTHNSDKIKADINADDRALIEEYFSRAETLRLLNGDNSMFGISLREAIARTKKHLNGTSDSQKERASFNQTYKIDFVSFSKRPDGVTFKLKFTNNSDKPVVAFDGSAELKVNGMGYSDFMLFGTQKFDKALAKGQSADFFYFTEANTLPTIRVTQGNAVASVLFQNATILFSDGTTAELKQ